MPWKNLVNVLSATQGMLLPGGAASLINFKLKKTSDYQQRIHEILNWVKKKNDDGQFYPVWGTCLGFEELVVSFSGNKPSSITDGWADRNKYHSVKLTKDYFKSKFFNDLGIEKNEQLKTYKQDIPYFYHDEGISLKTFNTHAGLKKNLKVLGTSKTDKGDEFIAILEAKKYPIYFVQYHPEKHQFEKKVIYKDLDRSTKTIQLMTSYIFKLVDLVRKNSRDVNSIPSFIQSYFSWYNSAKLSPVKSFERIYVFNNYFKVAPTAKLKKILNTIQSKNTTKNTKSSKPQEKKRLRRRVRN